MGRCHHPEVCIKVTCSFVGVLFSSQFAELNVNTIPEYSALSECIHYLHIHRTNVFKLSEFLAYAMVTNNLTINYNNVWHSAKHQNNLFKLFRTESALYRGPIFPWGDQVINSNNAELILVISWGALVALFCKYTTFFHRRTDVPW